MYINNLKKRKKEKKTKAFKSKAAGYSYVSYRFSQKQHNPACKSETRLLGTETFAILLIGRRLFSKSFFCTLLRCAFSILLN